ncbi:hypothetical protein [Amycolatopsis sp. NPDC051061]|uniref:hypothetical protein n=1 Tax=Amycolatopsis sp. NPDC051061 TaxID=3155042 RepID=UPI00343832AD
MTGTQPSWRLTAQERRTVAGAVAAVAASFLGPIAPLIALGVDYLYDRRDLMFTPAGTPVQAIAADRSVLPLSALHDRTAPQQAALSINTRLTDSARRMGLRNGDPLEAAASPMPEAGSSSGHGSASRSGSRCRTATTR